MLALSGLGVASAAERTVLKGAVDRGGRVAIRISSDESHGVPTRTYAWTFRDLTVNCSGERQTARLPVEGGFSINAEFDGPGPWGTQGTAAGDPRDPSYATEVSGRLVTADKAKGWVRVYGSDVAVRDGPRSDCDSGRLHWVAQS